LQVVLIAWVALAQAADVTFLEQPQSPPPPRVFEREDAGSGQPAVFNPGVDVLVPMAGGVGVAVKDAWQLGGTAKPEEYEYISIDQWDKPKLPDGVSANLWTFWGGSARSQHDHVLEIKHGSQRKGLFTHVDELLFHPTRPVVFLDNLLNQGGKSWQETLRLVDVSTMTKHVLPTLPCLSDEEFRHAEWLGDRLLTVGDFSYEEPQTAEMCLWNTDGTLTARTRVPSIYLMGIYTLVTRYGSLPGDPSVLYVYQPNSCKMHLVDVGGKRSREVSWPVDSEEIDEYHFANCKNGDAALANDKRGYESFGRP
jgi:hypothetical protein